jgi:hypothetical protein
VIHEENAQAPPRVFTEVWTLARSSEDKFPPTDEALPCSPPPPCASDDGVR